MAVVQVADIVVPEEFTPYTLTLSEEKSRIIQSGAMSRSPLLDGMTAGGGLVFQVPGFNDLAQTTENTSTDDPGSFSTADNIGTNTQKAVRLSRNHSWSSMDLAAALAGPDPLNAIQQLVSSYWSKRLQKMVIAMVSGINKDNGANDSGDYAFDIASTGFVEGVTNFTAEAQIDAAQTMGDSSDDLALLITHSAVMARMRKNNLIDFIPDSMGLTQIPVYDGKVVIIDDGMPSGTGVVRADGSAGVTGMYETWMFAPGALQIGIGAPRVGTEVIRVPSAGDGGGQETLHNRVEWLPHMTGHAYIGTAASGGPTNAATANNLNVAGSWDRVFAERKQIKFARLITRES